MKVLTDPLRELAEVENAKTELRKPGIIEFTGCADSQKLHLMYGLSEDWKYKVIVTHDELKAREIYEDYHFYDKNVYFYPAKDFIFYQADIHGSYLTKERLKCLKPLLMSEEATIVTTFDAFMDHLMPIDVLRSHMLKITDADTLDLNALTRKLVSLGYEKNYQVESEGQFSVRGGIVDIYPFTEDNPVRIELWGDDVDSIRSFDLLTQRSLEKMTDFVIFPATETVLSEDDIREGLKRLEKEAKKQEKKYRDKFLTEEAHRISSTFESFKEQLESLGLSGCNIESYLDYFCKDHVSFLDYFNRDNTILFLDEPARLFEKGSVVETEFKDSFSMRLEKGYILPGQMKILNSKEEIFASLESYHAISVSALPVRKGIYKSAFHHTIVTKAINSYNNNFEELVRDLNKYRKNKYRVLLLSASKTRAQRLCEDLKYNDLNCFYTENYDHELKDGEIMITSGRIRQGFEYPLLKFTVISESDIFTGQKKKKKKKKNFDGQSIASFNELTVGDYVVHESHGLGIYKGIEQVTMDKVTKDYMKIEYRDGGNLYIPATALDTIQKYSSKESAKPKLNKLGGKEWENTKSKVRTAVDVIANDLVELYAKRSSMKGYEYSPDTVWQTEFEEMFPFEETEDQLRAIEDTKRDMMSSKIMDRLICGDVGYGKTEIAIRAAFKAVQDGKQVAYLVPTTILAEQHYNTFTQRMKDYPIRVELLCRFRTAAEQKKTIADLKKGMVDVVIGTHRLLSKDVEYKDLGLLIIDEEQRFGVGHKEKIKKLKENIDVLTLTATPIPRTLHMSLVGIRDMSVLEEAPSDRMPIQTFVMEYNEEMVREAINRELARGGQVFYVYNKVNNIADITARVRFLVPEANVAYAHGQMKEQELERIMYDFVNGDIDVLVSTTIIETGLDISNVNTMIIHDSDRLGLSQLYQLRGRVGRSNRMAYAFLMYKKDKLLKEVAEKRLMAIRDFTELGSGFKIAMRDLEIRGAGNLLGERQSGHMAAVGYDLYCKMLNEAVKKQKGIETPLDNEVSVDLSVDAYIPEGYIMNEVQKLDIYKRIASIESLEEKDDMMEELTDRFGKLPPAVINLLNIAYLRVLSRGVFITEIKQEPTAVKLSILENAPYDSMKIPEFIKSFKGFLSIKPVAKPYFLLKIPKGIVEGDEILEIITNFVIRLKEIVITEL